DEELIIASSGGRRQGCDAYCLLLLFGLISRFAGLAEWAAGAPFGKRAGTAPFGAWTLFDHSGCRPAFALWRRGDMPQAVQRWRANDRWLVILLFVAHLLAIVARV